LPPLLTGPSAPKLERLHINRWRHKAPAAA